MKDLTAVIEHVRPSVLMGQSNDEKKETFSFENNLLGASGVARLFHDGVLRKMAQVNERPVIFAL